MLQINAQSKIKRLGNISWKEMEDESVLLDLGSGNYFSTNPVGLFIWKSLNGRAMVEKIARRLAAKFDVRQEMALKDTLAFINKLEGLGLVALQDKL